MILIKRQKKDKNARRNIRKIKEQAELDEATLRARKAEEERIARLNERWAPLNISRFNQLGFENDKNL